MRRIAVLLAVLSGPVPAAAQGRPLQGLDAYITRGMAQWKVPGLAIAVVRNDSVVLLKGYGVKRLGAAGRVDDRTLFAIGSATKAFTALGVAMLVDEEKVGWDDPATKHLPGFQLYDPYVTREITVRDLLSHRSGLPGGGGDLVWYANENLPRDSILHRVRYLKPNSSLRSAFGYQNIMFLAAGQLAARLAGRSWDELVRQRILTPLGMSASNTSVKALEGQANVATPHEEVEDTVRVVPWKNIDNVAPAGSINSNVRDMAQWVRFQLAGGKVGGKPLVSAGAFRETHSAQSVVPLPVGLVAFRDAQILAYGLGWLLHNYHGRQIVRHTGGIDGMSAEVALIPAEKIGVVVLMNLAGTSLSYAVTHRVFDAHLNQPPRDWNAELLKQNEQFEAQAEAEEKRRKAERVAGTSPSLAVKEYAGTYADSLHGEATVGADGGKLVLRYGSLTAIWSTGTTTPSSCGGANATGGRPTPRSRWARTAKWAR